MAELKHHYRTCNLCEAMCGIEIEVQDEQILAIRGDKDDPFSRGHVCPKAVALKDLHEDPDRLRQPLKRTADGWQEISWNEALDTVAERLRAIQQQHGHDAVAVYLGNPNVHNTGSTLMNGPFLRALKTRNKFSATSVDQLPHHIVAMQLFGHQLRIPVPDIDRTDFFLIFGGNPMASNGSIMTVPDVRKRLKAIKARGGRVVVVDPRRSETADLAGEHLFVRPGSDALVLLAMLHTLFDENLADPGHLGPLLDTDLDGFRRAVENYSPERVATHTGIDANSLRQLVRDFAAAERAVCYGRMGVSVQQFGTLNQYLVMLLNIVTGKLDRPGGLMFTHPAVDILAQTGRGHYGRSHSRVRGLPEFSGEYPVSTLAEEILTPGKGQVRALITVAGNPVLSTPNGEHLDQALASLDFMVAVDFYLNESSRHADIILPPVSPLEREHYDVIFHLLAVRNTARYAPALFPKPKDTMHDWEIFQALLNRLQPATGLPAVKRALSQALMTPARTLDLLLRTGPYGAGFRPFGRGLSLRQLKKQPHGVDLGELRPALPKALYHRDGRIHLCTDFFLADLQRVENTFFNTEAHRERPFLLIGRRQVRSNNSWLHNSHRLVKGKPRCTALIHPSDAEQLGVTEGQSLHIQSRVGSVQIPAEITDDIMRGVVSIPHGWGHKRPGIRLGIASEHPGVSVNDLTDELAVDTLSGNAVLNGVPVSVAPLLPSSADVRKEAMSTPS